MQVIFSDFYYHGGKLFPLVHNFFDYFASSFFFSSKLKISWLIDHCGSLGLLRGALGPFRFSSKETKSILPLPTCNVCWLGISHKLCKFGWIIRLTKVINFDQILVFSTWFLNYFKLTNKTFYQLFDLIQLCRSKSNNLIVLIHQHNLIYLTKLVGITNLQHSNV